MKKLIDLFKKLSPYDHFLVLLLILTILKVIDVFAETGAHNGLHFLLHGGIHFGLSMLLFLVFRHFFDKKKKLQHAVISTLLILLMVSHAEPNLLLGILVLVLLYVSKFFVKIGNQNVFNPIVFAIGTATLLGLVLPIGRPAMDFSGINIRFEILGMALAVPLLPITLGLIFNVGRIRRHALALSFIVAALLFGLVTGAYGTDPIAYVLICVFVGAAVIVEPKTAPVDRNEQIALGIGVALMMLLLLSLVALPNAIILALFLGNLAYFFYRRRSKPSAA